MPVKPKQSKLAESTPKSTPLYDNALPVSLRTRGIANHLELGVRLHTGSRAPLSPYIIEISGKQTQQSQTQRNEQTQKAIAQLAKQLSCAQHEMELDEAVPQEVKMEITSGDLTAQWQEPERALPKIKIKKVPQRTIEPPTFVEIEVEPITLDDLNVTPELEHNVTVAEPKTLSQPEFVSISENKEEEGEISKAFFSRIHALHVFLPKQARHRAMATFLVLSFLLVLPIHAIQGLVHDASSGSEIVRIGKTALEEIERATGSAKKQDFTSAHLDFNRATERFEEAQESLENMHVAATALVNLIPKTSNTYKTVEGLVQAGTALSKSASIMSTAVEELSEKQSYDLITKLGLLTTYITHATPELHKATLALQQVDTRFVPTEYQDKISLLLETTPSIATSLEEFLTFSETLQTLLGKEQKMRYLLAFQNNTELRATGGFVGSFAQIDVLGGEIVHMDIPQGGTYDAQGQLRHTVIPPQPLTLLVERWELQDANWFPDFPSSADKLLDFYKWSGGPTLDGVVAINATLMPSLLEILGPVEMPEYERTITAENFLFETQKIVELEYAQYEREGEREQDAPKQFIGDLAPILLERLSEADPETLLQVLSLASTSLYQKDVLVYLQDNALQSQITQLGWSGELKKTDGDFLMVVNTNLGGGKTDTVITQNIDVKVEIHEDGSIINTVTITKEHLGLSTSLFQGVNNVDYLRLYVPQGSELLHASGFEIPPSDLFETPPQTAQADKDLLLWTSQYKKDSLSGTDIWNEQGKTVFGNWMQTKPGEIETITFTYRLPLLFHASDESVLSMAKAYLGVKELHEYSLLVQKQPGVETRQTQVHLSAPMGMSLLWSSDSDLTWSGVNIDHTQDIFLSALFEQE